MLHRGLARACLGGWLSVSLRGAAVVGSLAETAPSVSRAPRLCLRRRPAPSRHFGSRSLVPSREGTLLRRGSGYAVAHARPPAQRACRRPACLAEAAASASRGRGNPRMRAGLRALSVVCPLCGLSPGSSSASCCSPALRGFARANSSRSAIRTHLSRPSGAGCRSSATLGSIPFFLFSQVSGSAPPSLRRSNFTCP